MPLSSLLLSTFLIGQVAGGSPAIISPATPLAESALGTGFNRKAAEPSKGVSTRVTADQLLAEALTPPGNSTANQPLTLLAAIAASGDRPRQLEAIHGYWRLAEAAGDYHYLLERQQRLARLTAARDEAADLRTAQAVATARVHEAEIRVSSAQHELAAALHLPENAPLPWPVDRPLTEAYRTRLAEMFAGKKPPDRVRLLDQTLPLRQRALESHAAAVLAAEESLDAAIELHSTGQRPLVRVLQALDAQVQQQQAFLAAACRYNDDIADYSLAVVPPHTTPETLVTTLIIQARPAGRLSPSGANVPASFQQPAATPSLVVPATAENQLPYREPARADIPMALQQGPALVVPGSAGNVAPPQGPIAATAAQPAAAAQNSNDSAPRLAPPQESAIPIIPPTQESAPPAKDSRSSGAGISHSAFKPVAEDVRPTRAAQLLTKLYDSNTAASAGRPVRLVDCLQSAAPARRLEAIEAYWAVWQSTAESRLLAEEKQWLDALKPAVAAQNPPSPTDMLDLRSAHAAIEARSLDAQAEGVAAEFHLAAVAGLPIDNGLPQPTSLPLTGHFAIIETSGARGWAARQMETQIPRLEVVLNDHAAAVTEADAARSAATAAFLAGQASAERALATIEAQATETDACLQSAAQYNRVIARYAIAAVADSVAPERLSALLMTR